MPASDRKALTASLFLPATSARDGKDTSARDGEDTSARDGKEGQLGVVMRTELVRKVKGLNMLGVLGGERSAEGV